ncbi:MAG: hypothetical protein H7232_06525, partial [Aeromicrobium sp.]|nr:hypothetical protein [Burkholderiales bacterium]
MSLLLDALKRAEDAKRAKAEAAAAEATPVQAENAGPTTLAADLAAKSAADSAPRTSVPLALVGSLALSPTESTVGGPDANKPIEFSVLSLEVVDDRPADHVAKSALNPAAATIPAGPTSPAQNDAMSASMPRASAIPATAVTLEDMLEGELGHP